MLNIDNHQAKNHDNHSCAINYPSLLPRVTYAFSGLLTLCSSSGLATNSHSQHPAATWMALLLKD